MQILSKKTDWDFLRWRKLTSVFSLLVILAAIGSFATKGINRGLDFTGGILVEAGYPKSVDLDQVREIVAQAGFKSAIVQFFGTSKDITIRMQNQEGLTDDEARAKIESALQKNEPNIDIRRIDIVGPTVGKELAEKGGLATIVALICIMIYVAVRFEWKFSLGSVAALVHDVIITLGIFSFLQIEFDLTILAAVLAVIGYSLNDTIVVFDRIRENFRKMRNGTAVDVINASLNQTLARTLMTSITTLLVLLSLFFLGGAMIHGFALALIIGVLVGTYSSVYIASTVALLLGVKKEDLLIQEVEKEGADQENVADYL